MTPSRIRFCLASSALVMASRAAAEPSRELARTDTPFLLAETGVSLGLALGANLLLPAPERCRWCEPNGFDRWGHDALLADDPKGAAATSHVLSFGLSPLAALGAVSFMPAFRGQSSEALPNAFIVLDAMMMNLALSGAVKVVVARQRPAFYYGVEHESEWAESKRERNLSFFSGDTSAAFSLAAAGSTVAFLRGYEYAPYFAVGSGLVASGVGVLRIAANVHWPTDVVTGALVGTAIGIGMPLLLHPRTGARRSVPIVTASPPAAGAPGQVLVTMVW